jgi:hypothetical protein
MMRLVVPVLVQHYAVPDGRGALSVQGQIYEELKRAMTEAGNTTGIPEGGALIDITRQNDKPSARQGNNPQHIFSVIYTRPEGTAQAQPAQDQEAVQAAAPQVPQQVQAMVPQGPGAPANFANPGGHYDAPGQQPQQYTGAPAGYEQPGFPQGQQGPPPGQFQNAQPGPPPPQYGMQGPAAQVAHAAQAGMTAAAAAPYGQPQYPQGQVPPQQQYPQGHVPPQQQYPQGQVPPQQQQYPQGQVPPQQYPQGQVPPQQYPQGQVPPQQYPQGQVPQQQFQQGPPVPAAPAALDPNQQQILATLIAQGQSPQ